MVSKTNKSETGSPDHSFTHYTYLCILILVINDGPHTLYARQAAVTISHW